jgi:hypothetical protein
MTNNETEIVFHDLFDLNSDIWKPETKYKPFRINKHD